MGKVKTRKRATGDRFTALYEWTPGVFRSAGTFDTHKEADNAWRAEEALLKRHGRGVDPQQGATKFAIFVENEWLPSLSIRLKPGTLRDYTGRYRNHLESWL